MTQLLRLTGFPVSLAHDSLSYIKKCGATMVFYCATKLTVKPALSDKQFSIVDKTKRSFNISYQAIVAPHKNSDAPHITD